MMKAFLYKDSDSRLRLSMGRRWSLAKIPQQAWLHQNEPFWSLPLAASPEPCLAPFFSES